MSSRIEKQPPTEDERWITLQELESWLEGPVIILGFVWLILLIIDLIWGLSPLLDALGLGIWAVFLIDFIIRLTLAPQRWKYLQRNWLTALSLAVPALRVFRAARLVRILQANRALQGIQLVRVVGSVNRSMNALKAGMRRRGVEYVGVLTILVILAGAAGMYSFERETGSGFSSYGEALWWTAMMMTTMGADYQPQSIEGRVLALLLAIYAFTIFGYVTAALAAFFIGRETPPTRDSPPGPTLEELKQEIAALRQEIHTRNKSQP